MAITRRSSVLFILDKWCEGNPNYGISEWETGLWKSLESCDLADFRLFHLDDYYIIHKQPGDVALLQMCQDFAPSVVCYVIYNKPGSAHNTPFSLIKKLLPKRRGSGSTHNTPTFSTLDMIKNEFKLPTVAIWGDIQSPSQVKLALSLRKYIDINVCTASSKAVAEISRNGNFSYFWVPRDQRVFTDHGVSRSIPISYVGSQKSERIAVVNHLRDSGIEIFSSGGERNNHLTVEEYANILGRSKIALSFTRSLGYHVINARAFEAMLCGAMLLEQEGFETAMLYEPFVDYVPFNTHHDLVDKARYYLSHNDERKRIAESGRKKTQSIYSANRFWETVLKL